jgi:hypothetical protein
LNFGFLLSIPGRAASEAWSDVLREAAGDKVLTNTKRLVKALKRREKQKEKSAAEWQVS